MALARYTAVRSRPSLSSALHLRGADGELLPRRTIGAWGEHLAVLWLRKQGCRVLYRNFRAPYGGEVDIVCRDGKMLCFVEVKTRITTREQVASDPDWRRPAMAVTAEKEALIRRGARAWLALLGSAKEIPTRCDIVEVLLIEGEAAQITRLQAAFQARS